jgi:hypothetical protein
MAAESALGQSRHYGGADNFRSTPMNEHLQSRSSCLKRARCRPKRLRDLSCRCASVSRRPLRSKRIAEFVRIPRRHNDPPKKASVTMKENVRPEWTARETEASEGSLQKRKLIKSRDLIARDRPNNKSFENDKFDGRRPQSDVEKVVIKELQAQRHGNHSEEKERCRVRVVHWAVDLGRLKNTRLHGRRCEYWERNITTLGCIN